MLNIFQKLFKKTSAATEIIKLATAADYEAKSVLTLSKIENMLFLSLNSFKKCPIETSSDRYSNDQVLISKGDFDLLYTKALLWSDNKDKKTLFLKCRCAASCTIFTFEPTVLEGETYVLIQRYRSASTVSDDYLEADYVNLPILDFVVFAKSSKLKLDSLWKIQESEMLKNL